MMLLTLVGLAGQYAVTKPIEVPFKVGDSAMIVDATVNGKRCSLMFDTGFGGSVVVDSSFNIGNPDGKMYLRDFVGQFEVDTVKVKSMKLGDLSVDPAGMVAVKQPGEYYSLSYNTHCTGIMGFEVINKYVTEINFEKRKFIFYPNSHDITKRQPDNVRTFLAKLLPVGNSSMEMAVEASNGRKLTLALDTGNAFFLTTHRDVLERLGLWEAGREPKYVRSSFVASGEVPSWSLRMKGTKIYGIPVPDSVWDIIDLPSSSAEHDGTVGFQFLKNFNLTIDYGRRRVWFENWTGKTGNEPVGDIGISCGPNPNNGGRVTVYRVSPGGPADRAGVKVGDVVLSSDGVELTDIGFRQLYEYFHGEKGTTVKLAISRKGELMRFDLVREYLVNDPK